MKRALLTLAALLGSAAHGQDAPKPLTYEIAEGRNLNAFLRDGPVAAHLLLRSGQDPRVLVAFPAGNSGIGLWFTRLPKEARWTLGTPPAPFSTSDAKGRPLHGITLLAAIDAGELEIRGASLSSVRVLRDYELTGKQPAEVMTEPLFAGNAIEWKRDRLDGAAGYALRVEVASGSIKGQVIRAGSDGRILLRITALTGETPLTPLTGGSLLNPSANADTDARNALEFLSFREKYLAGSWRFNTYFGRDTLLSLRLLQPALQPAAFEAGLDSVLTRLSPQGDVAHEEDVGEFAVLDHLRSDGTRSDAPVYDYRMIDETLLLAPVAADWLLVDLRGRAHAERFLSAATPAGESRDSRPRGALLTANLLRVVKQATPFVASPRPANLIALQSGMKAGNWRDSDDGLGGGTYPYDVNAVLMPAALDGAARLYRSGLLDPWLDTDARRKLAGADAAAAKWRTHAPPLFATTIPLKTARSEIMQAAKAAGISPAPALSATTGLLRFHAISLDRSGKPVRVLHSDYGFALLFEHPASLSLDAMVTAMMRPYPAGLMSDAGLLVANAAYAPAPLREKFSRSAYHGEVVWSWQQALLLAGLNRQLGRSDLPAATRSRLAAARSKLRHTIAETRKWANTELWSWSVDKGTLRPAAFGAASGDADESNAAQLWSTVYLGIDQITP